MTDSSTATNVYPVHSLDGTKPNHCYVNWTMRFNDVLDAEKLNTALSRLLEIGDWKKLGGRLRFNKLDGKIEIHPLESSQKRVFFTQDTFDLKIEDHPVARRFPKETQSPTIQPLYDAEFRPFVARPNLPTFQEMIKQDLPSISLHVTSFQDGTFVGIVWPHVLMDAFGAKVLLAAWSLVLAGKEEDIPLVIGAQEDFLRKIDTTYNDTTPEDFLLEKHRVTRFGLVMFTLRFIWDKLWNTRRERRIVFIPRSAFAKMKTKAQVEVATVSQGMEDKPFISDSDILTAWFTRAVALSEPESRPFTVLNLLNIRFRVPLLLESSGIFLQNMVLGTFSFLSSQLACKTVGSIALDHRKHCVEQGTEKQTVHFLKNVIRDFDSGIAPRLVFGESQAMVVVINNLLKADVMRTVDFSAAVLRQGDVSESRANSLGTMISYFNGDIDRSFNELHIFVVLGQDQKENYWILGSVYPRTWKMIEQELQTI